MVAGKPLEGKGTVRGVDDHRKEISVEEYYELTKIFVDGCMQVCTECQEYGKQLQQAFFVLIADLQIEIGTGKLMGDLTCLTQLSGDKKVMGNILEKTRPVAEREGWNIKMSIK